jgi:signal transduction histidine kinase
MQRTYVEFKNRQNKVGDHDDGQQAKKIDNSGLVLRNMRERGEQSNGKFKITSKVGAGTMIMVTVARKS